MDASATPVFELPTHDHLGPDPEPTRVPLKASRPSASRGSSEAAPAICPLAQAVGSSAPCIGEDCVFHRIPGVASECALLEWTPWVTEDPVLAAWFLDRRLDARSTIE